MAKRDETTLAGAIGTTATVLGILFTGMSVFDMLRNRAKGNEVVEELRLIRAELESRRIHGFDDVSIDYDSIL